MILEPPRKADSGELESYMQNGFEFAAAGPDRIWDRCTPGLVQTGTINVGNGFESVVTVKTDNGGFMVYEGPYFIETIPDDDQKLTFTCSNYFYIHPERIV